MNKTPFINTLHIGLFIVLLLGTNTVIGQKKEAKNDNVLSNAKLIEVFAGGEGFLLEGPTMAPDGVLYFSDITFTDFEGMKAGIIWRYNPETKETKVFRSPSGMANGLSFDTDGNLIICEGADFGGRRIVKTDMKTGKSTILAGLFNNKPFNSPNDLVIDDIGRIYFTDPRYGGRESIDQPVNGVYRIELNGTVNLVIANVSKPNGIAISPDNKTLYIAESDFFSGVSGTLPNDFKGPTRIGKASILTYSLLPDGNVQFKGELISFSEMMAPNEGADGLKVDVEGNLYVARGFKIEIYSPKGEKLAEVDIPNKSATNLCFGRGKWSKTLFITTSKKLYTLETNKEGYHNPFKK